MSGMSKPVKLQIYEFGFEEIVIDSIKAKSFDDFILIEVEADSPFAMNEMAESISRVLASKGKEIIIVPKSAEIGFYGFREVDNKELPESVD